MQSGYNIFVSGGTGSGKTTFLNAMSEFIPKDQRVITIEDSAELQMSSVPNLVRLEARDATMEGKLQVSIRDLVRTSLRMRADRIVVGECRGVEAIEMLQAFNTGHDGSFQPGSYKFGKGYVEPIGNYGTGGRRDTAGGIAFADRFGVDLIIHLERMRDGSRKVREIVEVLGVEQGEIQLQPIFSFEEKGSGEKVKGAWILKNKMQRDQKYRRSVGQVKEKSPWWK